MTRDQLSKRLVKISGRPIPNIDATHHTHRRDMNYIPDIIPRNEESEYETFFGFEEELSGIESARKQVERLQISSLSKIRETSDKYKNCSSFITLDEADDDDVKSENKEWREGLAPYTLVKGFEFRYCKFIKDGGERCKRQAPNGGDLCNSHR